MILTENQKCLVGLFCRESMNSTFAFVTGALKMWKRCGRPWERDMFCLENVKKKTICLNVCLCCLYLYSFAINVEFFFPVELCPNILG
jgi:hypothetical protein